MKKKKIQITYYVDMTACPKPSRTGRASSSGHSQLVPLSQQRRTPWGALKRFCKFCHRAQAEHLLINHVIMVIFILLLLSFLFFYFIFFLLFIFLVNQEIIVTWFLFFFYFFSLDKIFLVIFFNSLPSSIKFLL